MSEFSEMYKRLPNVKDKEIREAVINVLVRAPNHLAAAKKVIGLGPIEDIFGVGVLEEDSE